VGSSSPPLKPLPPRLSQRALAVSILCHCSRSTPPLQQLALCSACRPGWHALVGAPARDPFILACRIRSLLPQEFNRSSSWLRSPALARIPSAVNYSILLAVRRYRARTRIRTSTRSHRRSSQLSCCAHGSFLSYVPLQSAEHQRHRRRIAAPGSSVRSTPPSPLSPYRGVLIKLPTMLQQLVVSSSHLLCYRNRHRTVHLPLFRRRRRRHRPGSSVEAPHARAACSETCCASDVIS
jgi:hypothetical protein